MGIIVKKKCYISGKITGLTPKQAESNFKRASVDAIFLGYEPINPYLIVPDGEQPKDEKNTWCWHMKADIKAMMDCEAIFMQSNWRESKGAIVEHDLAKELNFTIIYCGKHKNKHYIHNRELSISRRKNYLEIIKKDKIIFLFVGIFLLLISFFYFLFIIFFNN
jgi:hypothetical protein